MTIHLLLTLQKRNEMTRNKLPDFIIRGTQPAKNIRFVFGRLLFNNVNWKLSWLRVLL